MVRNRKDISEAVRRAIKRHSMIRKGDTVVAAVSGGVDSVVMLHVLADLAPTLGFTLHVCHLNHGLRGSESKRDFDFVRDLAGKLKLGFSGSTLKPGELKRLKGLSVQEAARVKRYEFFEEVAAEKGADRVALGHNLDDQAETVLMRFIKGSGLAGLAGIPPVRGRLIRPLIDISREEVEGYARDKGLDYVEDSSNRETKYLRNDVRQNLIPYIEKNYNPNIKDTLARAASVISRDVEFLRRQANGVFPELVIERGKDHLVLDRKGLMELHESLRSRVFLLAAEILKEKSDLYSYHVKSFLKVIRGKKPNASLVLPNGLSIVREYDRVVVSVAVPEEPVQFDYRVRINGKTTVSEAGVVIKTGVLKRRPKSFKGGMVAYFDYDALPRPVHVRTFLPGDRFAPAGMGGSHKKIKELFIEKKIPKAKRLTNPLLTAGGEIVWVVGIRRSEHYQVTDDTTRILKVEFTETAAEAQPAPGVQKTARGRDAERRRRGRTAQGPLWSGQRPVYFEKPHDEEEAAVTGLDELPQEDIEEMKEVLYPEGEGPGEEEKPRKSRRRRPRRRSGRGRGKGKGGDDSGEGQKGSEPSGAGAEEREKTAPSEGKEGGERSGAEGATEGEGPGDEKKPRKSRRRRPRRRSGRGRGKGKGGDDSGEGGGGNEAVEPSGAEKRADEAGPGEQAGTSEGGGEEKPKRPRRRRPRRRSGRGRGKGGGEGESDTGEEG